MKTVSVFTRVRNWMLGKIGMGGRSRGFGYSRLAAASSQTSVESCSSAQSSLDSVED